MVVALKNGCPIQYIIYLQLICPSFEGHALLNLIYKRQQIHRIRCLTAVLTGVSATDEVILLPPKKNGQRIKATSVAYVKIDPFDSFQDFTVDLT